MITGLKIERERLNWNTNVFVMYKLQNCNGSKQRYIIGVVTNTRC